MNFVRIVDPWICGRRPVFQMCNHCYCITGIGLNGPNCRTPYTQCCRCGDRKASYWNFRHPIVWRENDCVDADRWFGKQHVPDNTGG
jgi:hypothetical protein